MFVRQGIVSIVTALVIIAGGPCVAAEQVPPKNHARRFAEVPVPNLEPSFTWLDSHRLLGRVERADGTSSFRIADARTGEDGPAFDHQALADALSTQLGRPIEASSMPITRVGVVRDRLITLIEPELIVFAIDGEGHSVERVPLADASPFLIPRGDLPVPGSGRTNIRFVNQLDSDVAVFWVSGGHRYNYSTLAPGESYNQGTVVGHRWIIVDEEGLEYGPFVAGEDGGIALIDVSTRRETRPDEDEDHERDGEEDAPLIAEVVDYNIVLRDARSGGTRQVTTDGTSDDYYSGAFHWSEDFSRLLAFRTRPVDRREVHIVESSPSDQRQPRLVSFPYLKPGDPIDHHRPVLFSVDPDSPAVWAIAIENRMFANPRAPLGDVHWRPDGSGVLFTYVERGQQIARVIGIDAATGQARTLVEETPKTFFDFARKMYFEPIRGAMEGVWMSERSGWNHLHRFDLDTGAHLGPITAGPWVVRGVERIDHDAEQIWFRAMGVFEDQDPYHVHFGRVGFDGDGLTWLTRGDGTHTLRYSPGGEYFVDTYSRADLSPVRELRRTSDGTLITGLSSADTGALEAAGWRPPEVFSAKGRDGATDIWGMIFKPTDFDPEASYPVVEQIYAGPHGHHVPKAFSRWHAGPREIAERGFVVVQIDGMGTNWRSKAFHDIAWQNLADAGFPDRIAWMREAAKTRPWMDLSRVGIFGGSAGGQNAMAALLHHNHFYDVAVADCGCHDNRIDKLWWNELWMGWPVDDEVYDASSNVTQAHRLEGDLLLIVGELDRNVDPASTMQVVDALIKADKDFDMLVLPGTGHGAGGTPYGRRRTIDFLVEHLIESPKE